MKNTQPRSASVNWERLLDKPRVYVDLNGGGRVGDTYIAPLDSHATAADLQRYGITPQEGARLHFWTDDGDEAGNPDPLLFTGALHFSEEEGVWLAHMDWTGFQHASEVSETRPPEITTSEVTQINVLPMRVAQRKPDVVL